MKLNKRSSQNARKKIAFQENEEPIMIIKKTLDLHR